MTTPLKLSLYLLLILLATTACNRKAPQPSATEKPNDSLVFVFDKRVETAYLVLMLTNKYDMLISAQATSYKQQAKNYFEPYSKHEAVMKAAALIEKGFSFDYAASWICRHSDFPTFEKVNEVDFPFYDSIANGGRTIDEKSLNEFRESLVAFYREAKCDDFFNTQKQFVSKMLAGAAAGLSRKDLPRMIEEYYGVKKGASFKVVLSPLLHPGGFEVDCINRQDGRMTLFAMIGPGDAVNGEPLFDKEYLEQDLIIHEFGHSYESDIVKQFMPQALSLEKKLFTPIKKKATEEGCSDWETFMHELIDRSVTLRIVDRVYGKAAHDKLMEYEKSVGFGYVESVTDELKIYESQRHRYHTLADFFPRIFDRLNKIK